MQFIVDYLFRILNHQLNLLLLDINKKIKFVMLFILFMVHINLKEHQVKINLFKIS
jgi:hypothetical protein